MKNNKLFLIWSIFLLFSSISIISASRLPTVGADNATWGTVLNDYLTNLAGPNATTLNQTMVNGTNIYSSTINTTHLVDGTITDADISDTTNLTLGEKITFTLGEIIDNIVNGWITITGGLNVTENVTADWFKGNLNWSDVQNAPASDWLSTYNESYTENNTAGWILNFTKIFSDDWSNVSGITELDPVWQGNYSIFEGLIDNASYLSTYNATYDKYATNVSKNYTLETYTLWNSIWSAGALDTSAYVNCSTTEVFLGNGSCLDSDDFYGAGTELDPVWNANYTDFYALIGNASYLSTYNETYDAYATNVSKNYTLEVYTLWDTVWSALGGLDGNASSICTDEEILLGNGSCMDTASFYDDTDTNITDSSAEVNCSTTEVFLGNGSCLDSDDFYDDTTIGTLPLENLTISHCSNITGNASDLCTLIDTTGADGNASSICSGNETYLSGEGSCNNITLLYAGIEWAYNQTLPSQAYADANMTIAILQGILNDSLEWRLNFTEIFSLDWSNVSGVTELDPVWQGNYSTFTGLIGNASYLSTYNATYAVKADYQFTTNNFNGSGDFNTTGNITTTDTFCFTSDCSAKMYYNGSGIIISS